jgi:hypothetical protein
MFRSEQPSESSLKRTAAFYRDGIKEERKRKQTKYLCAKFHVVQAERYEVPEVRKRVEEQGH